MKNKEISPIGLFFSVVEVIIFSFLVYKIAESIIVAIIVGPIIAIAACRPAPNKIDGCFLWERVKKLDKKESI